VRGLCYKTIAVTFQKRAGKRHVWLLYWNEAIGWDEMKPVSGLFYMVCVFGKGRGRRNGIGAGHRVNVR